MQSLTEYFELRKQIYDYFGYFEGWGVIPLDDAREYYWWCDGNTVRFSPTEASVMGEHGDPDAEDVHENEVYAQRFLAKWIYEGKDYTMIVVDTRTDGNKFLQVFDNAKRRQPPE